MAEAESSFGAWEPLTPRGVARFAHATVGRLCLAQFLVALLVATATVWFLHDSWCPIVRQAIAHLPDDGEIRAGQLDWHGNSPRSLAEGRFLAIGVDLAHSGDIRSPAHLQVEFGRKDLLVHSVAGYLTVKYPAGWRVAMNRKELSPWWGAWQPALLATAAFGMTISLMAGWSILAMLYSIPVWVLALFVNRELNLGECYRFAGAALMPGGVLLAVGILFYDSSVVDLVGLGFIVAGQLVLGWIYLFIGPLFLPRGAKAKPGGKNPFSGSGAAK